MQTLPSESLHAVVDTPTTESRCLALSLSLEELVSPAAVRPAPPIPDWIHADHIPFECIALPLIALPLGSILLPLSSVPMGSIAESTLRDCSALCLHNLLFSSPRFFACTSWFFDVRYP